MKAESASWPRKGLPGVKVLLGPEVTAQGTDGASSGDPRGCALVRSPGSVLTKYLKRLKNKSVVSQHGV